VGSYAVDRNIGNVLVTAIFGILGYVMIRFDYPRLTMVVALVLGAAAERNFHQTTMMSDGNLSVYFHRKVCLVLLAGMAALLIAPFFRGFRKFRGLPK
jgi:putative tricarboxylic transport membrane protein